MPVYRVNIENFSLRASNGGTIAQAMIYGTISEADLIQINESTAFPANGYNRLDLPEGAYSSQDVMMDFVRTIGPFLSDARLYQITHMLAKIETAADNTQAYRNSTLAKCFMIYEFERHAKNAADASVPLPYLSHLKAYVLPLCEHKWPDELKSNVNTFSRFNTQNSLLDEQVKIKYVDTDFYVDITSFNYKKFNPSDLSTSRENSTEIGLYLADLQRQYNELQDRHTAKQAFELLGTLKEDVMKPDWDTRERGLFSTKTPDTIRDLRDFFARKENQDLSKDARKKLITATTTLIDHRTGFLNRSKKDVTSEIYDSYINKALKILGFNDARAFKQRLQESNRL